MPTSARADTTMLSALALLLVSACSHAAPSTKTTQTALDAMKDDQRQTTFESTASALDQRPEYVDEFYQIVRKHPSTLHRFLANAARDLHEEALSSETAELVLQHPDSLHTLLIVTLDHVRENPAAVDALTSAVYERRELVADLITDDPRRLDPISATLMQTAAKKPRAREAIRHAMNDERAPVAHILVEDPATVGNLMKAMLDAGLAHSILQHSFAEATE